MELHNSMELHRQTVTQPATNAEKVTQIEWVFCWIDIQNAMLYSLKYRSGRNGICLQVVVMLRVCEQCSRFVIVLQCWR